MKKNNKKTIFWIVGVVVLVVLFLIINSFAGFVDFQELFIAGDVAPKVYSGSPGAGGLQ